MNHHQNETITLTRHLRMTAVGSPCEAQWLGATLLRNLLLEQGYLASTGLMDDGATAVALAGIGAESLVLVPARAWLREGYDEERPAAWIAGLACSGTGVLLEVPEAYRQRSCRHWWLRRPLGPDLTRGLMFVDEAIVRTRAGGFIPVQCPPTETVVA